MVYCITESTILVLSIIKIIGTRIAMVVPLFFKYVIAEISPFKFRFHSI